MERYELPFAGPDAKQDSLHPTIALFRTIAGRNQCRARRRSLRGRCLNPKGDAAEVLGDDVHQVDPSDDEGIPAASQEVPLNLPTYFSLPLSSLDPRLTAQCAIRPGDSLEWGSTKEPQKARGKLQQDVNMGSTMDPRKDRGRQQDVNMEDYGLFPPNEDKLRLVLAPSDVENATYLPIAGWPPYWDLYGCAPPASSLPVDSQIAGLAALDPRTTYYRAGGRDIVSRALPAAGAEKLAWLNGS